MCGIAISYKNNHCNPDRIKHRGLTGKTVKFHDYTMTHFKLPLQTERGDCFDQPIKLNNGNYLLFNGEIFNYPKEFKNDVEFLIDYFSVSYWEGRIGSGSYNDWDGFWAICIVTPDKVYAFTDPLGKKQLYYKDGCISSEIKPLLQFNDELDPFFPSEELYPNSRTPFSVIKRILPNRLHIFKGEEVKVCPGDLYDLRREPTKGPLYYLIQESVKRRMINRLDSNTLFVSGGLDSTIILHHLKELGALDSFQLLTIENEFDGDYIEILEEHFDCKVERIPADLSTLETLKAIKGYEYPVERGSLFPQYNLCKASKGSVLYSGDGADELFSGYKRAQVKDTQEYDVFVEIPYYHNIRLDRIAMMFTKELRSPFLGHEVVRYAMNLPYEERKGKKILKELYRGKIPCAIIDRSKTPLRNKKRYDDCVKYNKEYKELFNLINFIS